VRGGPTALCRVTDLLQLLDMREWRPLGAASAALAVGLAQLGCSATEVNLDSALRDAHDNEVRALDKYEGLTLRVSGTVEKFGLKRMKKVEYEHDISYVDWYGGVGTASGKTTSRARTVRVPYVVLVPEDPGLGRLLCFLDPEDRYQVADLVENARETVEGRFTDFRQGQSHLMLLMHGCTISGQ
jgi:hypothetical protein